IGIVVVGRLIAMMMMPSCCYDVVN
ncbi:hypothetical protein A2U01_0116271, partial [Trifolium medium]|nr:hypothetical protein [Trifolium medium]